ncbi:MAG: hypothetical protein DRP09_16480 [Candidatus Thorarchaeota archaeon]|nr:MAG: hypothetical protein DRP09_16480 [Candidatus Thorarchaeota archaeon]
MNIAGAINQAAIASTNRERIEALNRLTMEFYRTMGILFYSRYSSLRQENLCSVHPNVAHLLKNHFEKPTFGSWIELVKICADHLSSAGDRVAASYVQFLREQVPEEYRQQSKEVLRIIHSLRLNRGYKPPRKVHFPDVLESMRLLRNMMSHEWDSNEILQPLIDSGIDELVPEIIRLMMSCIDVKVIVPVSFYKERVEVIVMEGFTIHREHVPPTSEYTRHPFQSYVQYFDDEEMFRFKTNLIQFDRHRNICFAYARYSGNCAVFEHVPAAGSPSKHEVEFENLETLFELPEVIPEPLEQKHGRIKDCGETIHNLPDRLDDYVNRSVEEAELAKKLGHRKLYITTLDGGGGYGKTELAKKVVWDIIEDESKEKKLDFNYVVWVSGKTEYFSQGKIVKQRQSLKTVEDLIDSILYVTGNSKSIVQPLDVKRRITVDVLNTIPSTLLLLDNLETVPETEGVWELLIELGDEVETDFRVLVTSRVRTGKVEQVVTLRSMREREASDLTLIEMNKLDVSRNWKQEKYVQRIVEATGRIPLLIKHFVNLISRGYNLDEIASHLPSDADEALKFICNYQWNELSKGARKLLMGISFKGGRISFAQAKLLCGLRDESFKEAKEQLVLRSFLVDHPLINSVLELLPPISIFAKKKLSEFPDYEGEFTENDALLAPAEDLCDDAGVDAFTDEIALNQIFQRAEILAKRGSLKEAHAWYKEAVERFPESALAWRSMGEFEFRYFDDDDSARKKMEKAVNLDPKNPITLQTWAYWEYDRGVKTNSKPHLRKSIALNKKALKSSTDEYEHKKITDFIASAYMKMGYNTQDEWARAIAHKRMDYAKERDGYFRNVITLLEGNLYENPRTSAEVHHNLIDYNMLTNAFLSLKDPDAEERPKLDECALFYLREGLDLDMMNNQLRYTAKHPGILEALNRRGSEFSDKSSVASIVGEILEVEGSFSEIRKSVDGIVSTKR